MKLNDSELFDKIKAGHEPAFDELFKTYYAPLCRFAVMFLKNDDDAEEVVQAFFIKFWNDKHKIKISSSVKSYVYTSIRNASLNFIQKSKTRKNYEETYPENENTEKNETYKPEFIELYNKAVENLPERTKEVFILCKNEGLTYGEIAYYLKISAKTVENNMGIAFKKLRESLIPVKSILYE